MEERPHAVHGGRVGESGESVLEELERKSMVAPRVTLVGGVVDHPSQACGLLAVASSWGLGPHVDI